MSIYNSDANNSSFSILGNTTPSSSSRSSRGSRGSGRSGKSSNLLNTSAQIGSGTPIEVPDVVGLSRIAAINTLVADGFGYSILYTTASATSQNNDTVASQSMADLVVVLNVYQYVAPQNFAEVTFPKTDPDNLDYPSITTNNYANRWRFAINYPAGQAPAALMSAANDGFVGKTVKFTGINGLNSYYNFAIMQDVEWPIVISQASTNNNIYFSLADRIVIIFDGPHFNSVFNVSTLAAGAGPDKLDSGKIIIN